MTKRGTHKWKQKISKGVSKTFIDGRKVWNRSLKGEEYLSHYKKGFTPMLNLHPHKVGEYKHSKETKKKLSNSHKGKTYWTKGIKFRTASSPYKKIDGESIPLSRIKWMEYNNIYRIPKGFVIHHIDGNGRNNSKENLVLLDCSSHKEIHHAIAREMRQLQQNKLMRSIA